MEPATQFPSVPYSLSDIQLPDSPGNTLPKPQKTVSSESPVLNTHLEKTGSTVVEENSDSETHSNGVCASSDSIPINNKDSSAGELSETVEVSMSSKSDTGINECKIESVANAEDNVESERSCSSDENSDRNDDIGQKTSKTDKGDQDRSSNVAAYTEPEHKKDVVKDVECDEKKKIQSGESENEKSSDSDTYQHRKTKAKDISNERAKKRRNRRSSSSSDSRSSQSSESSPERNSSHDVPVTPKNISLTVSEENSATSVSKKCEDVKPRESELKSEEIAARLDTVPPRQKLKIKRDNFKIEVAPVTKIESVQTVAAKDSQSANVSLAEVAPVTVETSKEDLSDASEALPKVSYTPRKVSLSSRKINRNSADEKNRNDSKPKKSKWGSFGNVQKVSRTISISTDSLKTWFPDFKLINEPVPVNELMTEEHSPPIKEEKNFNNISSDLMESYSAKHVAVSRKEVANSELQASPIRDPVEQGPTSKIIFIQNLVRPFTLLQLKELLKQSGNIVEEQFWIDKIKSKCFVMYEKEEDAIKAKNSLHGSRWPLSNPKILSVEFATEAELEVHRRGNEPPKPIPEKLPENIETYDMRAVLPVEEHRKKEKDRRKDRERQKSQQPVREWDKDKILQDSPEREQHIVNKEIEKTKSSEKKEKKDSKKRPNEDTPAKLLDDLFRKTKCSPCIYWLPLTEEQVKQKEEAKRTRRVEREKRNQQQKEQEETERRNKRARSGHRSRETENRRSLTRSRSPISRRR